MNKIFLCEFCLVLAVCIISCKKNGQEKNQSKMEIQQSNDAIDLDLSAMNYNMLSSISFDVLIKLEKYVNKRMKVSGTFHTSLHDGHRYFSLLNWDATGCCPLGFDFIPLSALNFPE